MPFSQDNTGSPLTADGTWQTLITGDNSGNSAPAHYALSIFPETFYKGDRIRVLVETFDENDSTWHYYFGKELGYSDIKTPDKFIDADNSFIEAGIVSRWKLNSTLTDSVGNEDLTDNGTIAYDTSDKKEGSASAVFDGSTDYLTTTNDEPFDFEYTDAFSVSGWVQMDSVAADQGLVCKSNDLSTALGWKVYFESANNNIVFSLADGTTQYLVTSANNAIPATGRWIYFTGTYSGSSNQSGLKIYINGELSATGGASAISSTILNAVSVALGAESDGGSKLTGHLDDIAIYNYELSANQVKENFNSYLGLITHINFDNQVEDQFGSNDGTWTGTELYGVGKIDRSGIFDGSSYVTLANESNFDFEYTDPFSISFWVKTPDFTDFHRIIVKEDAATGSRGFLIHTSSTGQVFVSLNNTSNTNEAKVNAAASLDDGSWHHVAVTYDGGSDVSGIKIYKDNTSLSTNTNSNTLSSTILNNVAVGIGARNDGNSPVSSGTLIDDVKIWNKELTAEEVSREYGSKSGSIFNVFLPAQKFRVKLQQTRGHFRRYDFILYEVA